MPHDSQVAELSPPSITNERCRELLGPDADGLTDEQIDAVRRHADAMAHLLIDIFLTGRSTEL
jgi:hypothetical protein